MASLKKQLIALILVTVAVAIYIGIGMIQAGGIRTYWGRLPPTGGQPLVVVTEPLLTVPDAAPAETPGTSTRPPDPKTSPRSTPSVVVLAGPSGTVYAELNRRRSGAGLDLLQSNARLVTAAQAHADDMASRGYFDHTTPEGTTFRSRMAAAGIEATGLAENLGLTSASDLTTIVGSWMSSPEHRANVLGGYATVGIGVASGVWQGHPATYIVAIFSTAQ